MLAVTWKPIPHQIVLCVATTFNKRQCFSYLSPEERVPQDHPLRRIRHRTEEILKGMSSKFARMYSRLGRLSVPPEKLLRALLLQVLYTIRSERMLMEQLDYKLLFRWFVGLNMDEAGLGCHGVLQESGTGC